MNAFLQTLRNLGPMRLVAIAVVGLSLLGMLGFITTRVSTAPLALLYTELDQHDSAAIAQKLDALKVPYQVDSSGSLIRVPSDQVGKIRMLMAADGLPKGGSIGYEIFDQKEGFGTTSFVQNINHLRAMEGELARTISAMDPIQNARVHLVLPQRELFSHATQLPTASIFLKMRNGAVLSREQIAAIQHLIAAAVPQLQPNQVSIVDDRGNLLARPSNGAAGSVGGTGMADRDDMRLQFEQTQVRKIEDLLTQTFGYGKVRAQVSADLDFDRITTSSEIFDPESQVVRSTQSIIEDAVNAEGASGGTVSVGNNLPASPQQITGGMGGASTTKNNRSEETINYEINKTVRNQVRESGRIRRLSVAVVVDGSYKTAEDGSTTYTPRTEEEMAKIRELVRSAVNYDATRGDVIEVVNMQFAQTDISKELGEEAPNMLMGIPRADLFHAVETIILAFIGLLVVVLLVRPILKKILDASPNGVLGGDTPALFSGSSTAMSGGASAGGVAQLPSPGGSGSLSEATEAAESEIERMIDISRVEGRVKASSLRKVGEIVDKHPDEAISILRNWMYQESR
ncbi:MAG: flagellar basal-body MS-ring/collar protein FliF [Alphaproteobacteria bacterium]|nr:flagellar basal-body MS-ring/collar protein FliF [Alphaproteobacteria bacterium]